MNGDEQERDLEVLLGYLLNRTLTHTDVIAALGIGRSTYYDQRERGQLTSPANLITAATYFNLNPIELLIRYGHVDIEHVHQVWVNWESYLNRGRSHPTPQGKEGTPKRKIKQHLESAI